MRLEYVGDPDRVYPSLGVEPKAGQVYDLPENPGDGRWREPETTVEKISAADDHPGAEQLPESEHQE